MSLTYADQQIDAIRAEAEQVQRTYSNQTKEVKANTTLSEEGKKLQLDAAYDSARTRARALLDKENSIVDAKITELETAIDSKSGNTSSDVIAFRDAQDRAERLDSSDDADKMLERAIRTGDRSLAHAIFRRALEANWSSTVQIFEKENPNLTDVVKDLRIMQNFKRRSMERTMQYHIWRS
jgi:hypothetical protein